MCPSVRPSVCLVCLSVTTFSATTCKKSAKERSSHIHSLAWLPDTPGVEQLGDGDSDTLHTEIIRHADQLVSTTNPAVLPDGSNIADAPAAKVDPHICNKGYGDIHNFYQDLADLVATCQRHTRCSACYCLHTKHSKQECRFGYPKPLQPHTTIITEDALTLLTARNDGMINSFNPVQLSAWRANVDMQYIVSHQRVLQYCTKYVTKSEPRPQSLKEIFTTIIRGLREDNTSLKAVQKLLINTVGERETTLPRRPAICYCSYQCSRHQMTSSSSASMGLVLLRTTWKGGACYSILHR